MNDGEQPYEFDADAEPLWADEPDYEEGPIAAGDAGFGHASHRRPLASAHAPYDFDPVPDFSYEQRASGAIPSVSGTVLNFFKYLVSLAGVFFAVLALEVLGLLLGAIVTGVLSDFSPLALSDDDELMLLDIVIQLTWLAVAVPWWLRLRRRGIGLVRRVDPRRDLGGESPGVQRAVACVMLGVGLQIVISLALAFILPLFPDVMESYESMMDDSGVSTLSLLGVLSVAVLAPVVEELTFRGIAFQFSLRAVCPGWSVHATSEDLARMNVGPAQFWAANVLQALAFGVMHLNITQGVYAFLIGLVCGWMFWRTGRLRWGMALHATLNLCSYFVSEILDVMGLFGLFELGQLVFPVLLVYGGVKLFARGSAETALA